MRYPSIVGAICLAAVWDSPRAAAEDRTFDSDGTSISFTIEGNGEAVVLIHGYRASGDLNWRLPGIVKELAKNYRVVTIDARGHGKSGAGKDTAYGVEMVRDVARLLDHLDIERAHLVGYSMGGMIAIKFLTLYPDRAISAVVGGMGWVQPGSFEERRWNAGDDVFSQVGAGFRELSSTSDEMRAIKAPVVAIVGSQDGEQIDRIEAWKKIRPDLAVITIEGAQHTNCIFAPQFRESIVEFLGEHRETDKHP